MKKVLLTFTVVFMLGVSYVHALCKIPKHFQGNFFSLENGENRNTMIDDTTLTHERFSGTCLKLQNDNKTVDALGHYNSKIVFHDNATSKCYKCYEMYYKTPNIIQYKRSPCRSIVVGQPPPTLEDICSGILAETELDTMFKTAPTDVECKATIEGMYQFSYEVDEGGGGICDSSKSVIKACREPGSPYLDNPVFWMNFTKCPDVSSSRNEYIRFRCLGSWMDDKGNKFAGLVHLGRDPYMERFRCLLTRDDQQRTDNKRRYTLSRWATCSTLRSPYDGPIRLIIQPALFGEQYIKPSCDFPRNFSGSWYSTNEYDMSVTINKTHIYFKTLEDQFWYKEAYFSCLMTVGSRFLVAAVTVGKCEIDHVCFDFLPRHHNIIRWRMSKPYRLAWEQRNEADIYMKKFREACHWGSFTYDREDFAWQYKTFILDPPSPVNCPVAGRFKFEQIGLPEEKYFTRIRGITERPRNMIDCRDYVTEWKVCGNNPKRIQIDAEYCASLDHTGRPIGEYDEPDNELDCVGYWNEDMKFYLVTYEPEDAISKFRCWVYERLDWKHVVMSRSATANCAPEQTATNWEPEKGATLMLKMIDNEREFDECPQQFDTGLDPYAGENADLIILSPDNVAKTDKSGTTRNHIALFAMIISSFMFALL